MKVYILNKSNNKIELLISNLPLKNCEIIISRYEAEGRIVGFTEEEVKEKSDSLNT